MEGYVGVNHVSLGGGLAFLWKEEVKVKILSKLVGHIDSFIELPRTKSLFFIGFYGNPETSQKKHSWELRRRLYKHPNAIWLISGDFNEILSLDEKLGGEGE